MKIEYKEITLENIIANPNYTFECDGDSKTIIMKRNKEEK